MRTNLFDQIMSYFRHRHVRKYRRRRKKKVELDDAMISLEDLTMTMKHDISKEYLIKRLKNLSKGLKEFI